MTDDLVKRLRKRQEFEFIDGYKRIQWEDEDALEAADEIERLTKKCDMQAMILRRLTPENYPDILFIHGTMGDKDQNGMPEKLMVVPAFGVDFSYIYEYTGKKTGLEW
jgi:hypothetical protein